MPKYRYRGNPGYAFIAPDGQAFSPAPGDVVDLSTEAASQLGADFEPVDGPPVFDVETAKKADLTVKAGELGLDLDPASTVGDLRAAVAAAINGQEG